MKYIKQSYGDEKTNYIYQNFFDNTFFESKYPIGTKEYEEDVNNHLNEFNLNIINDKQRYYCARMSVCSHPSYFIIEDNIPECLMLKGDVAVCINCFRKKSIEFLEDDANIIELTIEEQEELEKRFYNAIQTDELEEYIDKLLKKEKRKSR